MATYTQPDRTKHSGRLAILMPGLGAVATTVMAGVELIRRGRARPVGSITQLGELAEEGSVVPRKIASLLPLVALEDVVFGAWDISAESADSVARRSGVLSPAHLAETESFLAGIQPRPGVHDPAFVRRLEGSHVVKATTHRARITALRADVRSFLVEAKADRAVMLFTASTEVFHEAPSCTRSLVAFEQALDLNDPAISPTMLYAYAALRERVPFANGTPNRAVDTPAFEELANELGVAIAGKDFKSGQTYLKTALAPALKARQLGLNGWFSTNILGNRDGEVLDDPGAFRSKEVTKTSVLEAILEPASHGELYGRFTNKVAIHYYPPRGDEKEGWDNVDIFGWLGYPMQIKVNFLCRDSILAAPLALDLALLLDVAQRAGWRGTQEWLGFFFKSPMVSGMAAGAGRPEHDLFVQQERLHAALRRLASEEALQEREAAPAQQRTSVATQAGANGR